MFYMVFPCLCLELSPVHGLLCSFDLITGFLRLMGTVLVGFIVFFHCCFSMLFFGFKVGTFFYVLFIYFLPLSWTVIKFFLLCDDIIIQMQLNII